MPTSIGFIGLGSLGTPIALNIIKSGAKLFVYNRTLSKTGALAEKGAEVCPDIATLSKKCQVIFSIVSDDAALKSICEGEAGLIQNMQAETVHVSMSTILPQTAAELSGLHAQKGQYYLASPVFGRPQAANAKKLHFVISGQEKIRRQIEPLLKDAGGAGIWDFGDLITAANTVKLCGNFLIASAIEAIGESVSLASNSGVDPIKMWAMLSQTLFNAPVYHNYSDIILQQKFEPAAFSMKLGLKDMNLVLQQASFVNQPMPLGSLLQKHMQQMVDNNKANIDWSALSGAAAP